MWSKWWNFSCTHSHCFITCFVTYIWMIFSYYFIFFLFQYCDNPLESDVSIQCKKYFLSSRWWKRSSFHIIECKIIVTSDDETRVKMLRKARFCFECSWTSIDYVFFFVAVASFATEDDFLGSWTYNPQLFLTRNLFIALTLITLP